MRANRFFQLITVVGLFVIGSVVFGKLRDRSGDGPSKADRIASSINASYCEDTGYYVKSRLDGSKETIYECGIGGSVKCVTEANGIASDSTAVVRLLFENTLGNSKPSCI